jgi:hypothetical protein
MKRSKSASQSFVKMPVRPNIELYTYPLLLTTSISAESAGTHDQPGEGITEAFGGWSSFADIASGASNLLIASGNA